ncbi:MAG: hypothetical protein V8Q79_05250 [Christensenellales bacterium]
MPTSIGMKHLTGQTEAAEDTVHDERDTRHIAAVLQNAQHEEQDEHLRNKAKNRADAADDTIDNQAGQPLRTADAFKKL